MKYYDNTRVSDYRSCPRYFYLRHIRHLVPDSTALPLIFGLCWHDAMDAVWPAIKAGYETEKCVQLGMFNFLKKWKEEGFSYPMEMHEEEAIMPRSPSTAAEMLFNYVEQRREFIEKCELIAIERPFAVPLQITVDGKIYIGRMDKVVRHPTYKILVIEHKTTTDYAKEGGFKSSYVESWSPASQIDGYLHASHSVYGHDVKGVWIDAALVHKTVHDKFKFIPLERATAALDAWLYETREWIRRIESDRVVLDAYRSDPKGNYFGFPKDTGSCSKYWGCVYRDVCRFVPNPETEQSFAGFVVKPWEPFDLLKIGELGLERETTEDGRQGESITST